jgi:hypothetical protein
LRLGVVVEAKQQQCRLQLNNNQVPLRASPTATSSSSSSTSATGYPPTSASSGSSSTLPSATPFNYGTEPIRGVNLYVSLLFSRAILDTHRLWIQRWMACPRGTYYTIFF